MSYSLNSLEWDIYIYKGLLGITIEFIKGDTGSLDYGSCSCEGPQAARTSLA